MGGRDPITGASTAAFQRLLLQEAGVSLILKPVLNPDISNMGTDILPAGPQVHSPIHRSFWIRRNKNQCEDKQIVSHARLSGYLGNGKNAVGNQLGPLRHLAGADTQKVGTVQV